MFCLWWDKLKLKCCIGNIWHQIWHLLNWLVDHCGKGCSGGSTSVDWHSLWLDERKRSLSPYTPRAVSPKHTEKLKFVKLSPVLMISKEIIKDLHSKSQLAVQFIQTAAYQCVDNLLMLFSKLNLKCRFEMFVCKIHVLHYGMGNYGSRQTEYLISLATFFWK